jgi:ParB family transcriptional regulator, chromosome partitioning protein
MSDKKALGRGLSALLSDVDLGADYDSAPNSPAKPRAADTSLPIEKLHPNPNQPRRQFAEHTLAELAQSIKENGIIQPLIVRPHPEKDGEYQIVAGERRWRAAQVAQVHVVPVVIREMLDNEVLQVAIIENIQRADLNPIEESRGYRALMDNFGHTQEKLAEALGKSRSYIANSLRLMDLPSRVQGYLEEGRLTAGHARACLAAEDPLVLAQMIMSQDYSVREAEIAAKLSHNPERPYAKPKKSKLSKDPDIVALEYDLHVQLGYKVVIEHDRKTKKGELRLLYRNLDELDALIGLLSKQLGNDSYENGVEDGPAELSGTDEVS